MTRRLRALAAPIAWLRSLLAARDDGAAGDGRAAGLEAAPPGPSAYLHFATGIAHELNNPLMAVAGMAELGLRTTQPRESLDALLAATRAAARAVQRLQQLGEGSEEAAGGPPAPPLAAAVPEERGQGRAERRRRWMRSHRRPRPPSPALAEESHRAGRLTALASGAALALVDLDDQLEEVVRRTRAAAVVMPDKGEQMLQQARRAREIGRELSRAFRLVSPGAKRTLQAAPLLEQVVEDALDEGLPLHVSLEGLGSLPSIAGDPRALSAAAAHLVRNAAQASPSGVLRIRGLEQAGQVVLQFHDDGPGVPPAVRPSLFDPFFTTRRVGEGVGLGLTLVHFVARDHGGSIVLEDVPAGACFTLRLPAAAAGGVTRVVRSLLSALPTPAAPRERVPVNAVVEDAVESRRLLLAADGIATHCLLAGEMPSLALEEAALRQVVLALLDRAAAGLRAAAGPRHLEVSTAIRGDGLLVTVADSAPAPPGSLLRRLMTATLEPRDKRGASEAQSRLLRERVERLGGSLAVGRRVGGGTEFVVRLPLPSSPRAADGNAVLRSGTD